MGLKSYGYGKKLEYLVSYYREAVIEELISFGNALELTKSRMGVAGSGIAQRA